MEQNSIFFSYYSIFKNPIIADKSWKYAVAV